MFVLAQYLYYFFRSLVSRGVSCTIKLLYYEWKYEKQIKINTTQIKNLNTLTLCVDNHHSFNHYQAASYYILFKVLHSLPKHCKTLPFIDYGCGKGRALFVAEQCGFTKLIGIDIAKELIEQAQENVKHYVCKNKNTNFLFHLEDATTYDIPTQTAVFYFFNPFNQEVLLKVIQNIYQSILINNRKIYCVYINPQHAQLFINKGFTIYQSLYSKGYCEAIIFEN